MIPKTSNPSNDSILEVELDQTFFLPHCHLRRWNSNVCMCVFVEMLYLSLEKCKLSTSPLPVPGLACSPFFFSLHRFTLAPPTSTLADRSHVAPLKPIQIGPSSNVHSCLAVSFSIRYTHTHSPHRLLTRCVLDLHVWKMLLSDLFFLSLNH